MLPQLSQGLHQKKVDYMVCADTNIKEKQAKFKMSGLQPKACNTEAKTWTLKTPLWDSKLKCFLLLEKLTLSFLIQHLILW